LRHKKRSSSFGQKLDKGFASLEAAYGRAIKASIHQPLTIFIVIILSLFTVYTLFSDLPSEYTPKEDRGNFFVVMRGAEGASYENNVRNMQQIEEKLLTHWYAVMERSCYRHFSIY
jgi:multidrug efflux pump